MPTEQKESILKVLIGSLSCTKCTCGEQETQKEFGALRHFSKPTFNVALVIICAVTQKLQVSLEYFLYT